MDDEYAVPIMEALLDIRTNTERILDPWRTMNKRERKRKIFEEIRADKPRYDAVAKRLEEALERARERQRLRREAS